MKQKIKYMLGMVLAKVMPKRASMIKKSLSDAYWHSQNNSSFISRLVDRHIREYLSYKDLASNKGSELERLHREFWAMKMSSDWYKNTASEFDRTLSMLESSLDALDQFMEGKNIATICEIGTGDAELLHHLAERYNCNYEMIGLDLSNEQINLNAQKYVDYKFYSGDASEWIFESSTDNTLFLTNHGVFEYFSENSLNKLFAFIQQSRPLSALAMISEPVAERHMLDKDKKSILTTMGEYSFSHNYPFLVEDAGLKIEYLRHNHDLGFRSVTLMAVPSE